MPKTIAPVSSVTDETKPTWPLLVKQGSVTTKIFNTPEKGRDRFTVEWYEGGLRKRLTRVDLGEARKEAKVIAQQLNAGRGDALELNGTDRDAYLFALSKLKSLGIGLAPAIEEFIEAKKEGVPLAVAAKFYRETHSSKLPDRTVMEVYTELLEAKKTDGCSSRYLGDLKSRVGRFASDFKDSIANIQTADIDAWLRGLKIESRTRNNYRNAVQTLFSFAKASGYLNRELTTAAEHASLARKVSGPIEVFSPSEMTKLLAASDEIALPFLVLGGFCGLRTEEILRLDCSNILWSESAIEIRADVAKTRVRRLAPLNKTAAAWLSAWKKKQGAIIPVINHRYHVGLACEQSGVEWKANALRHSYISYTMAIAKDPVRVAYECGNSPQIIRSNYDRVVTKSEGKKWFAIMPKTAKNVIRLPVAA
jgi:integrase